MDKPTIILRTIFGLLAFAFGLYFLFRHFRQFRVRRQPLLVSIPLNVFSGSSEINCDNALNGDAQRAACEQSRASKAYATFAIVTQILFVALLALQATTGRWTAPNPSSAWQAIAVSLGVALALGCVFTAATGIWCLLSRPPNGPPINLPKMVALAFIGSVMLLTAASNDDSAQSSKATNVSAAPSTSDASPSSLAATQSNSCDEVGAQKIIDMATLADPALFLRVKDGSHVRYTFTFSGWAVASPQSNPKFTQLALSLSESESCVAGSVVHLEFYRWDGQHVASVSPWTGVNVDGE